METVINADETTRDIIVIGASAGGIAAFNELVATLPADLPATLCLVVHRGAHSPTNWSITLGRRTKLRVVEPSNGQRLLRGTVYVAPSDRHVTLRHGMVWLDEGPKQHHTRPAVDPLFTSAASEYGPRVLAIVLSGGGYDGTRGLLSIASAGGIALVQSPAEAEQSSMPRHAMANDHVSAALSVPQLRNALEALARGQRYVREYALQA